MIGKKKAAFTSYGGVAVIHLKLYIYSVLICTLLATGCDRLVHDSEESSLPGFIEIHLQERFKNNRVRIELDGHLIFEDKVTSNRAGLARILSFDDEAPLDQRGVYTVLPKKMIQGDHKLDVWIDDTVTAGTKFTIADTLFIGIRYNMNYDDEIEIDIRERRFIYY